MNRSTPSDSVYAQDFDRGSPGEAMDLEQKGLAYQEVKGSHRAHPGTGSGADADAYRAAQRAILIEGTQGQAKTVSSAVQFNQLEYAHLDRMEVDGEEQARAIATASYEAMVRNGESVTFVNERTHRSFQISQVERAEMLLAHEIRTNKVWPTQKRVAEVLRGVGLEPLVPGIRAE